MKYINSRLFSYKNEMITLIYRVGFFSANEGGGHPMYIFMKQKEMINKGKIHVFVITISKTSLYRFGPAWSDLNRSDLVKINLGPIKTGFIPVRMNEYR